MKMLLSALLPGLVPVLVFVAVDSIFGEIIGCIVGLAVGIGELVFYGIKDRRIDPFIMIDTALLAVACGLSLLLKDELFFKLKPAVIEAVIGVGLAAFLALPGSALKGYISSHMRGISIPDSALPAMQRSLGLMLGVLALHAGLTVWAALSLSTAAWGFISGALLYILFGVVVLAQFVSARRMKAGPAGARPWGTTRRAPGDSLPVIDEEGKVLEISPKAECHKGPGRLHPAVRLIITDGTGRLYLQRHGASSEIDPDLWETAIAAHVPANETSTWRLPGNWAGSSASCFHLPDPGRGARSFSSVINGRIPLNRS